MAVVASISQQIWDMKYRLKGPANGPIAASRSTRRSRTPGGGSPTAAAAPETDPQLWAERFYAAMSDFRFLPAGRVIAGAGAGRQVTLFNCFVMGAIPDDMGGIFAHLREAALTMQQGGGIGYDFSTLRPRGAYVKGVGADASGPLSFMDVWDAMCRTIMSAGYRRGAMMATLRCDHPDIEAFIEAKREPGRLRMFNLSVLVTDAFMQAVEEDAPWELSFGGPARPNRRQGAARARAVGQDHARDLRLCRAGRHLHRPHQPPQQSLVLRADPRDQPLRRAALAALRRLPAGLDEPGALCREPVHAAGAARYRGAGARSCPTPCG